MIKIDCNGYVLPFDELNRQVRASGDAEIEIDNCLGQRYIGAGENSKKITINGTAGNALGAYLNGGKITVKGNAQDATGDTMNQGEIVIYGSSGDATGYAMRGGSIFIKDNAGYRAGIHMKAYKTLFPVLVIGGRAGNFLGEYQAGGLIIVLALGSEKNAVGYMCGTGMHGGKIFIRADKKPPDLPKQVCASVATDEDKLEIKEYVEKYCSYFDSDPSKILSHKFYVLTPNTKNPYKQMYVQN